MNKNIIIIIVILGIIAGAAYWYYYQAPTQTAIEEQSAPAVSGAPTVPPTVPPAVPPAVPPSDTSAAINQDLQSIDINSSGADFQEINSNLNNL